MARYSDDEVLPAVSGICITYMPQIIFDWHDELITSGRIHYLQLRGHVTCDRDRTPSSAEHTVVSALVFVSDSLDSTLHLK